MQGAAASWEVRTTHTEKVATALSTAAAKVRKPVGALVFLSGPLGDRLEAVSSSLAEHDFDYPVVVAAGAGVLTERGEVEDQSAAAGVVWGGGRVEALLIPGDEGDDLGEPLAQLLSDRTGKTSPTVIVFAGTDRVGPATLLALRDTRGTSNLFGAGTTSHPGAAIVRGKAEPETGSVALILRGIAAPAIRTAHCSRLLTDLATITRASGAMVLEIDGEPALDVLAKLGQGLADQPLVFTMLANEEGAGPDRGGHPQLVVRGVQGVDPDRRGIVISEEIREGMRIAFAVRDATAARDELEAVTRELERDIAGAAPRFGIYINCAGRGMGLYGAPDVDTRILKSRFGDIPIAGMQSAFEIAPHVGDPTLHLYTGVLALFTAPS